MSQALTGLTNIHLFFKFICIKTWNLTALYLYLKCNICEFSNLYIGHMVKIKNNPYPTRDAGCLVDIKN